MSSDAHRIILRGSALQKAALSTTDQHCRSALAGLDTAGWKGFAALLVTPQLVTAAAKLAPSISPAN